MNLEFTTSASDDPADANVRPDEFTYRISSQPLINSSYGDGATTSDDLPRSYGTETLTLMARDPHSLFAYWDIDWSAAFGEQSPRVRKVHLRILGADGSETISVEVEPMAGSCRVDVPAADAAYHGEIGYFTAGATWKSLARSEVVSTPPDSMAESDDSDFATVPFHLTFQHMLDALRISKQENESLTALLSDLRERAAAPEAKTELTPAQRELASALDAAEFAAPKMSAPGDSVKFWTQQRLERVLGSGPSSPAGGFGNSSGER